MLVALLALPARAAFVRLAWDPHPDPTVAGYKVYVGPSAGSYDTIHVAGLTTSFEVLNLNPGGTYTFAISAYNSTGAEGPLSTPVTHTLPADLPDASVPVAHPQWLSTSLDTPIDLVLTGTDSEGDALSFVILEPPVFGTLRGFPPNLTYTPDSGFFGTDGFIFTVSDGGQISEPSAVLIAVDAGVSPPSAMADSAVTEEDQPYFFQLRGTGYGGGALSYEIVTEPTRGTLSGELPYVLYTPDTNYAGLDFFEFLVRDSIGASMPARVSLVITPVNDAPSPVAQNRTLAEDSGLEITLGATDPEGDAITYAITTLPTNGTVSIAFPTVIYQPNPNFNGTDRFRFTARDATSTSAPVEVSLTVTPVNDRPTANSFALEVPIGVARALTLSGSDVEGSALTYSITQAPTNGTLSGVAPSLTYTPRAGFSGVDTIRYTSSDGTLVSAAATVSVTVASLNQPPTAIDRSLKIPEDTSLSFYLRAADPEGDPITYTLLTQPTKGVLSGTPPSMTYKGKRNYAGPDSFKFTVRDAFSSALSTGTVYLSVTAVNDQPVATPATYTFAKNTSRDFTLKGTDVEGSSLTFRVTSFPASGTISGTPPALRYTPPTGFVGTNYLKFTASDGSLTSTVATITFNVTNTLAATSTSPTSGGETNTPLATSTFATADSILAVPDQNTTILLSGARSVLENDVTDDDTAAEATLTAAPRYGTIDLRPDGRFTYRTTRSDVSYDSFTYAAVSPGGEPSEAHVWIQFAPPPTISLDGQRVNFDVPVAAGTRYRLEAQDADDSEDSDWDPLVTFTAATDGVAGTSARLSTAGGGRRYRVVPLQGSSRPGMSTVVPLELTATEAGRLPLLLGPARFAGSVQSVGPADIELIHARWIPSELAVADGFVRHLAIVVRSTDPSRVGAWWPVVDNSERRIQLGPPMTPSLRIAAPSPGDEVEIATTLGLDDLQTTSGSLAADLRAAAGTLSLSSGVLTQPVVIEGGPTTPGGDTFIVVRDGQRIGPIPAAVLRFMPGDLLRFTPTGLPDGALPVVLQGRVPSVSLIP